MKKIYSFLLLVGLWYCTKAQNWVHPMDTPMHLVCNFGHLRSSHFHFGIDVSTEGVEQKPIYAAADGTISRIVIKRGGYGKALYVNHENNYTSVYGHCHHFTTAIESYIDNKLLNFQTPEFDWTITDTCLAFKAGDIIAFSGNTGHSTGPHLHFEIRNTQNQMPLNPQLFLKCNDTLKPIIKVISFFKIQKYHLPQLITSLKTHDEKYDTLFLPVQTFGMGLDGADWNDFSKKHGLYKLNIDLDNTPVYHHVLDHIDFDESEYVKWYTAAFNSSFMQNCFSPDVAAPDNFKYYNNGVVHLSDTLFHHLNIYYEDESGNTRSYSSLIKYKNFNVNTKIKPQLIWDTLKPEISISGSGPLKFKCPANLMMLRQNIKIIQSYSSTPQFTISAPFPIFYNKLAVVWKNADFKNQKHQNYYVSGPHNSRPVFRYQNDSLCFSVQEAGLYKIKRDFHSPKITSIYIKERIKSTSRKKRKKYIRVYKGPCRFKILDAESGVKTFKVFVNGTYTRAYLNRDMILELKDFTWESLQVNDCISIEASDHCHNSSRQTFYGNGSKVP